MTDHCQVDFYLLATPGLDARRLACRLALMSWERGHHTTVIADSSMEASEMDALMWESPPGRFLPHDLNQENTAGSAPVIISLMSGLKATEVVINLCPQPIPEPDRFQRLLEIVPHQDFERENSREKFRVYRGQGISPRMHEIRSYK